MKSKKLISLLCAAALSASSFAGLAVTASAASDPVWSFDGSDATGWSGSVTPTVKTDEGSTDNYLNFEGAVNKQTNDTTFTLPTEAQLSNDYVLEYDTYIHGGNGMGRLNHYTQLAFTGANPVQDTQTYGGEYATAAQAINPDTAHSWSQDLNAGMGYTTDIVSSLTSRIELSCQGRWVINQKNVEPNFATDGTTVGDDKWVRVRAAVKDGKAAVTIADSNQKYVDAQEFDVDATKLSKIMLTFARADQVNFVPTTATTIKLDNIKVYDGIANAPAFSTDGLRATAVVATPIPAPEKVAGAAPKQYAPEAAITPYIANFNSAETGTITHVLKQEGAQEAKTVVNGMKVQVGTRKEGEDTMTYASIVEPAAGDKALRLNAGDMSTNGRGPVVSFDDDLSIEDLTGTSTILGFSTYISRTHLDGISRLFLLDNTDNVDGNSVARDVLAVITTEDIQNEDESYKYTAGEKNIGIHVEPEQWHKIAVAISENEYRVFVDGQYKDADGRLSPALKNDLVGTGEGNKNAVTHLPMFAIENTKTSSKNAETGLYEGGSAHATALIDNVVAYQIQGEVNDKLLPLSEGTDPTPAPPTPTPVPKHSVEITQDQADPQKVTVKSTDTADDTFDGVLIHVAYNTDKTLKSVKSYDAKSISKTGALVTIPEADTVYAGDKLMVWNSLKDMVPYGSADAKGVQTFAVTGTIGEGVAKVVFTDSTDNTKVFETTTGTVNVPAGTYALTVAAKSGYENAVVTPTSLTVSADVASGAFNATATKVIPKYAVKGTVDAGVATVTLTNKTDNSKTYTGSIDGTAVSFANVEEGTYTISATFVAGKEVNAITPAEITVDAQTGTDSVFAITSKDSALPAITGTVAIDGTAKVGQTLTATVTGLNDGKAAKYQWQANTGAEGAYVAIENATNATFEIPESLLGKTIKVVVTADGTSGSIESAATAAVAAKTYTVSGTVDAGVDTVKLHVKDAADHTADIPGTIDGTTVTFANVPAGTYTVEATAKTGYKNVVVKVGETATATVTVTDANVTNIAITTSPISTATIGVLTGATNIGDKTAEDLSATLAFAAPTAENKVAVTGTLKYVDSYPAMGAVAQTHYYLPYKISGLNENAVVYVQSKDGSNYTDPETNKTYKKVTSEYFDNTEKTELFGVQAVSAAKNSFTIMVDSDGDGTVYDKTTYTIDISALTLAEPTTAVPYAAGTVTYEDTSSKPLFVNKGNVDTISVTEGDSTKGNATKVEKVTSTVNNYRRANAIVFQNGYQATGTVKITFDYLVNGRMSDIYIVGEDADLGGAKSDAAIVTKNILGLVTNKSDISVKSGSADETASLNVQENWAHVEAVVNTNDKTTSLKIYNYKANNNYANAIPVYTKDAIAFKDNTITGVAGLYIAGSNGMDACFDNVCITPDEGYVYPNKVTVTAPAEADGTLAADKTVAKTGDLITVTATAKAGKKLTAVKANDTVLSAGDDGKYTYTMPDPAVDVTISATYARADVTAIEISGDAQVSVSARTANYTAVAKADTTPVDGTITWSIAPAETGGATITGTTAINSSTGVLTLDPSQGAGKIVITASTKKDITSDSAEAANTVTATKEVTLLSEPVYGLAVATGLTGGSVALKVNGEAATQVKQSETLTIEPTAAAGYNIDKVYYILTSALDGNDPQWTEVTTKTGDAYTVAGTALTGDITVKATFTAIPYAITNATVAANGNSAAIKIGDADAGTATVGQTVTIVPTVAQGYKVASVAVTKTGAEDTVTVTNNTFKMPAYAVTVTVTFEAWDGIYGSVNFDSEEVATISGSNSKDIANAVGTWKVGGTSGPSQTKILSIAGDKTLSTGFTTGSGNCFQGWGNNTHEYVELTPAVSAGNGVKISFDMYFGSVAAIGDAYMSIGDAAPANALLHLVANSNTGYTNITALPQGETLTTQMIYYYDAAEKVYKSTGIATGSAINVVETINTDGTASVVLTSGSTVKSFNLTVPTTTSVGRFNVQGVRINGSAKGTALIALDNILITAPWYTAPSAGGTE